MFGYEVSEQVVVRFSRYQYVTLVKVKHKYDMGGGGGGVEVGRQSSK